MGKTTLFIHIGTWKTGSTTIQFNCNRYKEELKNENIVYLSGDEKIVTDDRKIRKFKKMNQKYISESREKLNGLLKKYDNPDYRLVTSAEEFSGDPFTGYKNGPLVSGMLREITKDLGLDVKIIIYLRRQDDFFESLYTHSIYLGKSHTFHEFLNQFDEQSFNWKNLVDSFAESFGKENIIVKRYHKKFLPNKNSLIRGFGKIIESNKLAKFEQTYSKNTGFSRDTLEIMRIINKEMTNENVDLRRLFRAADHRGRFEKFAFFSEEERAEFYSRYEELNTQIASRYLNLSETSLFPAPDKSENLPVYPGLELKGVVVSFSRVLLHVNKNAKELSQKAIHTNRNRFLRYRLRKKISGFLNNYPKLKTFLQRF
jgi:hypothetical protein